MEKFCQGQQLTGKFGPDGCASTSESFVDGRPEGSAPLPPKLCVCDMKDMNRLRTIDRSTLHRFAVTTSELYQETHVF
jgi:hypothetical protein